MFRHSIKKIRTKLLKRWNIPDIGPLFGIDIDTTLLSLGKEARRRLEAYPFHERKKILYLPSFYISNNHALSDATNILALQLRGAEVVPVLSGFFYQKEDIIFGGFYNSDRFNNQYSYAQKENRLLASFLMTEPISLTPYLSGEDNVRAEALAQELSFDAVDMEYRGIKIGKLAESAVINMSMTSEFEHTEESLRQFRCHISNIVRLIEAYEQIIDTVRPDAIVTNFHFYYKWAVPHAIAKEKGIPIYSFIESGDRPNAFAWSSESVQMYDASLCWDSYYKSEIYEQYSDVIEQSIKKRKKGKISHWNYINPSGMSSPEVNEIVNRINRRTAILFAVNVLVDASALYPGKPFSSCFGMVKEVIEYFRKHPEYFCILKAHPGEKLFPRNSLSDWRLVDALRSADIELPENVVFIDSDTKINSNDLYDFVNGLIAYTSSASYEIALTGKKSLNALVSHYTKMGFCTVPETKEAFFIKLTEILSQTVEESVSDEISKLGRAFYFLFHFIVQTDLKLFDGDQLNLFPLRLLYDKIDALLPGKNEALDYICDSILTGKPIFGENRWPPVTI